MIIKIDEKTDLTRYGIRVTCKLDGKVMVRLNGDKVVTLLPGDRCDIKLSHEQGEDREEPQAPDDRVLEEDQQPQ